jgi:di/tricarboxylate transporter
MPEELSDISKNVMNKINHGELRMRPRFYFVSGSILSFVGLVSCIISSIFLFGLIRFSLRSHGPMAEYRLEQILGSFPWVILIIGILSLVAGIWLLRKYDFAHKINIKLLIIGFVVAVVVAGYLIDVIGVNDLFYSRGYMNKIYRQNNIHGQLRGGGFDLNYYEQMQRTR